MNLHYLPISPTILDNVAGGTQGLPKIAAA
jgi:hypothetical protein